MIKSRKGQVTIFVIIAILIVAGIAAFFIFRNKFGASSSLTPTITTPAELLPITNSIQTCVQTTLQDGTKLVGFQGGYILPPTNALETNFSYIAWGYYLGQNTLASESTIQSEIAKYIELTLPFCFDTSAFPNYKVITKNPKASVIINQNSVSTSVSYPFTATKVESSWEINNKYPASYPVKLGDMYNISKAIVLKEAQNPNSLDITFLSNFKYDISVLHEGNNIAVYSITDYNQNITGGAYTFRFANKIR